MNWNKESIENSVLEFVKENGYLPHPSDYADNDNLPCRETFRRYLGIYPVEYYLEKYPELCGKGYTDRLPKNFREEKDRVLKMLDNFVDKNHRIPRNDELTGENGVPTSWEVRKYCGSITSLAIERYPEYCNKKYSDSWIQRAQEDTERIIEQVKRFVGKNERMPTKDDLCRENDMPTYHQVRNRFGSLKGMIEEIYPSEEEAVEEITLSM